MNGSDQDSSVPAFGNIAVLYRRQVCASYVII